MEITHAFWGAKFPGDVIVRAFEEMRRLREPDESTGSTWSVYIADRVIEHDSLEEALVDYRQDKAYRAGLSEFSYGRDRGGYDLRISYDKRHSSGSALSAVTCRAPSKAEIEKILRIFIDAESLAKVPTVDKAKKEIGVFIGHGRNTQWRDLKDHLADQHGYKVEAYETGARAGHQIRDILDSMAKRNSFALLVMTAEDEQPDGSSRARQNVVHEIGLFQGALGFDRAIVLLEDGTEEFSNLHGIHQIRFGKGRIRETFGDVLATLRREFHKL